MYFLASKTVWALTAPTTFLLLMTAAGVILLHLRRKRAGLWLASLGTALLLVAGFYVIDLATPGRLSKIIRTDRNPNATVLAASSVAGSGTFAKARHSEAKRTTARRASSSGLR